MKKPNINYVSVLDGIKSISARNKAFDKLDDQSKRLEIAWDALKLVSRKKVQAADGHYWSYNLDDIAYKCSNSKELQENLSKTASIKGCTVCARGAVMLSLIRLGNNIGPDDDDKELGSEDNLRGFDMATMINMEREYEHCTFNHPYEYNTEEKLMNILCNVLVNGNFNVIDKTDYLI